MSDSGINFHILSCIRTILVERRITDFDVALLNRFVPDDSEVAQTIKELGDVTRFIKLPQRDPECIAALDLVEETLDSFSSFDVDGTTFQARPGTVGFFFEAANAVHVDSTTVAEIIKKIESGTSCAIRNLDDEGQILLVEPTPGSDEVRFFCGSKPLLRMGKTRFLSILRLMFLEATQ